LALEVNDFNALRISLASPEQIRSWSYGEVTKPETINYRTLKPEKDGLFCEKIFGPTKDFECYCGKYKRVRYKGIVCDKCGVEVTRTKVRRERMGHIELASPVAHIWFVKGTPSRIGLLLDMSPRSLERVLYFAQFVVTSVNEDVRSKALEELTKEMDEIGAAKEQEYAERISAVENATAESIALMEKEREEKLVAIDADLEKQLKSLSESVEALQQDIERMGDKPSTKKLALGDFIIAERYKNVPKNALKRLQSEQAKRLKLLERTHKKTRQTTEKTLTSEIDKRRQEATKELEPLRKAIIEEKEAAQSELQELVDDLEDIKDPVRDDQCTLLPEPKLREIEARYPDMLSAGMGADAVLDVLRRLDLDALALKLRGEIQSFSGQRRKKATKRLRVVEAFRKSGSKPDWMVFGILPVLPPDLRPMVQLDGGRFATSDLNDLYRRVINRNNRLKRLLELGAPEIIIRNEKRMLQEAVDSLIDNGRRGRAVSTAGNHKLKSLSDMLKGKQGRFRQNLLGKRVDYSGRSVIVVGPELELHQCGIPKRMALELFKPFVMHALVARNLAHNIKSAKRIVERARPEVWDILDDIIKERPVLLNRAPTLHRLGIQAFEPILIDGSAIQIHPLVCTAFNADFDGDQMAVHVPLSRAAVAEARQVMLSTQNLLLPSNGEPVVAPTLEIVFGCYYLTDIQESARGEFKSDNGGLQGVYASFDEAKLAYDMGHIDLRARIRVRDPRVGGELIETTVGRIIFNEVLPDEIPFRNEIMDKKALKDLVSEASLKLDNVRTAEMVDRMKNVGFHYATRSGVSIAMNDLKVPEKKEELLAEADKSINEIEEQFNLGLITEDERYGQAVAIWRETTDKIQSAMQDSLSEYGGVYLMAVSGAKGNISQIAQMAGMRGLMSDPAGRIIDLPIRSSFREGLTVLEYFISTHGARKGLADTALRTADSGYLTRRLIDVSQDVIILEDECGTSQGIWVGEPMEKGLFESLHERIVGRWSAADTAHPETGEVLAERNTEITEEIADRIVGAGIDRVYVRSPLTCQTKRGICAPCYGRDLARGRLAQHGEAVGIIAAQSIGEPGTQLTMRTFHTGGVAGLDITSGLPRVEELFEARVPKGSALIAEIDGLAEVTREGSTRRVKIVSTEIYRDDYTLPEGAKPLVKDGEEVEAGAPLVEVPIPEPKSKKKKKDEEEELAVTQQIVARTGGIVAMQGKRKIKSLSITFEERDEREYGVPATARLRVQDGDQVHAGQPLTDGPLNPQDILRIQGPEAVQIYLVEEVQKVYRSQGVTINDKHIEVIVRQMLRRVRVDSPGDSELLPGELVDRFRFEAVIAKALAEGGEPATAQPVLLGVTKASLNTESFLAAASFQETARVLTEAAINGSVDHLLGLKENVIIGKLIPASAPIVVEKPPRIFTLRLPPALIAAENGETPSLEDLGEEAALLDEDEEEDDLLEGAAVEADEQSGPEAALEPAGD
jgi:DNA-directed RNA polymerase subunit beta'